MSLHRSLTPLQFVGEKIVEPVHSCTVGQGSMAAVHGAITVHPSVVPLRRFHDGGAQHVFS
jgi:hypothetical protein